jgi:O-6-methylguanine DNA methyltransferase
MLARLETGGEEGKCFDLSPVYVPQPLYAVLRAAAAIPRGYVASYGAIATAAGTDARSVGKIMAANPLYPIVPCHRVVGSDLSLVGYGGSQRPLALRSKLRRLRAEARGYVSEHVVECAGRLMVSPVEWAIAKAVRDGVEDGAQLGLL